MKRDGYIMRINDLLDSLQTLLDENAAMGERIARLEQNYEGASPRIQS